LHGCHTIDELRALAEAGEKTPDGRDARATLARAIAYHERVGEDVQPSGRWPANVLLDQNTAAWVDEQSGEASRFFYTEKAPKRERPKVNGIQHPTVKPLAIMEWLIRLVTPPNGTILDPFAGSGTTLEAAQKLGFKSIGVEAEGTYLPLIDQRLQRSTTGPIEREGIGE